MGTLYIVSTPIGNLDDITLRAIDTLKSVDLIVCEDTRISGKLLAHYQIEKPMLALNDFNETRQVPVVISRLEDSDVALVSDAGTPLISDPGYKLVREAIAKGIKVESIPGPSSIIAALTVSGLPPDKFFFFGYLSKKDQKRQKELEDVKRLKGVIKSSVIFFESPYRLLKTLEDIKNVFGDIDIVVCRELTKVHEEVKREKVSSSIEHFAKTPPKGEFVVLI